MKIYVASSWRNDLQPSIVAALRDLGHDVYDFKNPPNNSGFSWSQVAPDWKITDGAKGFVEAEPYKKMLAHPVAAAGYLSDITALRGCDAVVYVLPVRALGLLGVRLRDGCRQAPATWSGSARTSRS
jgi:hypothetical protein